MQFGMLGPLEVSVNGGPVPLGGRKQRALLALLLLHANRVVSRDRLIDALWGECPPPSAAESLDAYLSRLRKLVGHDRLSRRAGGYVLHIAPEELDAERFERVVANAGKVGEGRDAASVARELAAALAIWRGPPLADLTYEPFAQSEIRRLEQLRLAALENRVDAELGMGLGPELVPELEQLAAAHPERERLTAGLMLALYRAGRQTDALAAYQSLRRRLVEELALEPGPELQGLERRILQQDHTLLRPRRVVAARSRSTRRTLASVTAVALAAVVAVGFVFHPGQAHARPTLPAGANGLLAMDIGSAGIAGTTPLSGAPGAVASGESSVWATEPGSAAVLRIDPETGGVVDHIPVGGQPGSIASGAGAIWVASTVGATVVRIDPATETVTQTITLPGASPGAIGYGLGRLWVADPPADELFEINPARGTLERTLPLDLQPSAVAVTDGAIWVAGYNDALVEKIAPASGQVTGRVRVGDGPVALTFGAGALWVANSLDATVSRIDPGTLKVRAAIPVGSGPAALAAASGSVWVASQYSATVSRIDPVRNQVVASVDVGGAPISLTMGSGRLWVGVAANGGSHRGGTLVIVTPESLTSTNLGTLASADPAFYNIAFNPQFTGLAYDALVTFQQTPGSGGLRLVPDLALEIPAPAHGGTTYAFRLRPGIRYSDGQPLRAGDFRRGVERLFRVRSPGTTYYSGLVGAAACARQPGSCDLSRGIVTDDATGSVVFHLTGPDPQFLDNLTEYGFSAPIPAGTPDHESASHFVPGTGPYKIAAISDTEIRFVRNPLFREWSHAAQPAGNPDAIVWRSMPTIQDAAATVEHGRADWLFGLIPRAQYRQLQLHSPAQLHSSPEFTVDFAQLNTHRAPFDNVRVRQALNYAIDRRKIVQLYGGPGFATPTCQVITPGLPGSHRYCPYTRHPRPDGAWSAQDLARARRLIRESGTIGEPVNVWGASDNAYVPSTVPAYVGRILRALGYRVRLHLVPFATITEKMRQRFQLSVDGDWVANYPDPSSYLPQFFGCSGGNSNGYYCNPQLDRKMQQAGLLQLSDPAKSSARWALIDRQLTNDAIWLPTVNEREVDLVSRRLRNYEYNPLWGFLADQAWLRKPLAHTRKLGVLPLFPEDPEATTTPALRIPPKS
jgi:YVTN family beta-propeller protein